MGIKVSGKELIPVTWLIIDEAHLLLPASGKTAASESLIEYAKLGRKPGCGLVFATQRPSATNEDILSQVDTIIGHNLALEDDIASLRRRIPAKMPGEFKTSDFIRSMPVGIALIADQKTQQRTMLVQIRPRMTHHSGKAALPKSDEEQRLADETEMNLKLEIESQSELKLGQIDGSEDLGTSPEPISTIKPEIMITEEDVLKPSIDVSDWEIPDDEENEDTSRADLKKQQKSMKTDEQSGFKKDTASIKRPVHKGLELDTEKGITDQVIDHDLAGGGAYILVSKESKFGLNIYENNYKQNPRDTLCITRTHPNKLDLEISKDNINQIWLSKSSEKNSISPGNITKIAHVINEYLKINNDGVILLDGLEYLITNNDFPKILKFIESVHERIVVSNGIILIPINPLTLSKNNLDLLDNELRNTITDTMLDQAAESPEQNVEKNDAVMETKKDQKPKVRRASKEELKSLCKKLGLRSTGKIEELKKRLLDYEEGEIKPSQMDTGERIDRVEVKAEVAAEESVKPEIITDITAHEEMILKELGKEREAIKSLLEERKKLEENIEKLRDEKEKHQLELKRKKLLIEREKLKEEKEQLEADRKKLEQQLQLKAEKLKRGSGLDIRKLIDANRAKQKTKSKQPIPKQPVPLRSKKGKRSSAVRDLGEDSAPKTRATSPTRKGKGKGKDRADIVSEAQEKRLLVIKSRLRGGAIEEFAIKQLKTSLLGKPVEVIKSIRAVYLPILRIYVKAMRGTLFAKEHSGIFYWDMVTGEVITDFGKVLKRSKGLSMLIDLSPNQAKVLAAMDTWGSNDI
ncbi:MAG: DUF853 family protein, partial [Deltaproteobacteria bacterium]|nr:DUF853 family protein [Deltaproteobacteria bacterium]